MLLHNAQYKKELVDAIQKTVTEKYIIPLEAVKDILKYQPYLNEKTYALVESLFLMQYAQIDGTVDLSLIKGQCIGCHSKMLEILEIELGFKPILTIGYVNYFDKDLFKFTDISKNGLRVDSITNQSVVDIHVWLTLPSLEIIDFTFLAHFHYVNADENKKLLLKKAKFFDYNFGSADYLKEKENIIYHPIYVGKDALIKNGYIY